MDPKQLLASIDREALADLALTLGKINSPSGLEREVGDHLYDWLRREGFEAFKQRVTEDRYNVVGVLRGTGSGLNLIFNSHMDTKYGIEEDIWAAGELRPEHRGAWREGDRIFGQGVFNCKGPMSAFLMAAKTLKDRGVRLKGDLYLTMVVGEIGMAPVDEFQGGRYLGKGVGSRHLVDHGVTADFAFVAECTSFTTTWAEAGCAYFKITTRGKGLYTPFIPRPTPAKDSPNAVVKMAQVIGALEKWADRYIEEDAYKFEGGTIRPNVSVGAIRGGLPFKIGNSVGRCSIYLDVRIPPNLTLADVQKRVEAAIATTGIQATVEPYMTRKGYVGQGVAPLIEAIERAHRQVFSTPMKTIDSPITSMWRDVNVFNEVGIPSATYGPVYAKSFSQGIDVDAVQVEDLLRASKVYAAVALDICNQERRA